MNALSLYRKSRWCKEHHLILCSKLFHAMNVWFFSCKIPATMPIGKGTKFAAGGMCLNFNGTSIGNNCRIGTGVVIMRAFPYKEKPVIKNNVYISHGVKIQGPVIIEDNAMISANSVVTKSVPKNAIVAGVPAKIIGYTNELGFNPMDNPSYKEGWKPYLEDTRSISAT